MNQNGGWNAGTIGIWEGSYRVRQDEIGDRGELQIPALFNFLQDAAIHHASELGVSVGTLEMERKAWVLRTIRVRIDTAPVWGEVVTVQTWPTGVDGLLAYRDFQILDSKGRTSVLADSSWLIIDRDRRRPVRLPSDWKAWTFPDRRAFGDRPGDRLSPAATQESAVTRVETRDLDFNAHVNHVRYIEWILQPLPVDFLFRYRLAEMAATFMQEAVLDEQLRIECSGFPSGHEPIDLQHRISRLSENDTVVAATTSWVCRREEESLG